MTVSAPELAEPEVRARGDQEATRPIEAPPRVLVVEDNRELRLCVQEALEMWGFRVDTAPDGLAAVEAAFRTPYQVVVTDIRLPGMNGLGVIRSIKTCRPNTKVIVMTAFPDWSVGQEARAAGASYILHKPLDLRELSSLVDIASHQESGA